METRDREPSIDRRTVLFWSVGLLIPACSGARAPRKDPYPAANRAWPEVVERNPDPAQGTEPVPEPEPARRTIRDVGRRAHATTRALLRIESKMQAVIGTLDAARHAGSLDRAGIADIRQELVAALEGWTE